jgi:NCS1 family nucleobase:cation symporter-1
MSSVVVTVAAFVLILWLHAADSADRFQNVLLFVSYWVPAFAAVVAVDWWVRSKGRDTLDPALESTERTDAAVAVAAFVVAYLAAIPFMNTSIFVGSFAERWHGADIAYFVNFVVALVVYGGYRWVRLRR